MSGFSPDWLHLREPADRRARNAPLLARTAALFADAAAITVTDLGCGTGSNLRAMADALPARQVWRLVDHDAALLAAARGALGAWADEAQEDGEDLHLRRGTKAITVRFVKADLARDCGAILAAPSDLITAAALIDLASPAWLDALPGLLGATAFYTVLAYDGREQWTPPHPHDAAIAAAFVEHQARDKGFGPAAGPDAAGILATALRRSRFEVFTAASPWVLGASERALIAALAQGIGEAALETGRVAADIVRGWQRLRREAQGCRIGHTDLLAVLARGS